jgi:hypothetical protein
MKAAETACRNLAIMMQIFGVKIEGNGYRSCYYFFLCIFNRWCYGECIHLYMRSLSTGISFMAISLEESYF